MSHTSCWPATCMFPGSNCWPPPDAGPCATRDTPQAPPPELITLNDRFPKSVTSATGRIQTTAGLQSRHSRVRRALAHERQLRPRRSSPPQITNARCAQLSAVLSIRGPSSERGRDATVKTSAGGLPRTAQWSTGTSASTLCLRLTSAAHKLFKNHPISPRSLSRRTLVPCEACYAPDHASPGAMRHR